MLILSPTGSFFFALVGTAMAVMMQAMSNVHSNFFIVSSPFVFCLYLNPVISPSGHEGCRQCHLLFLPVKGAVSGLGGE
jgi:hypothetical protein